MIQAEVKTTHLKELSKMHCVFSNRNIPNKEKKQETRKEMCKIRFRTVFGCFPVSFLVRKFSTGLENST